MNTAPGRLGLIVGKSEELRNWLLTSAFPMWWRVGADRHRGGYHERIALDGYPVLLPQRSRVAARQVYCFVEAGRLGWDGPWQEAARHALHSLRKKFVQVDGTVSAIALDQTAGPVPVFDLYDQAFALLAYAYALEWIEPAGEWRKLAYSLVDKLRRDFGHPRGGFWEDQAQQLPLRANPHMHLLESALAWMRIDQDNRWPALAGEIVDLCLDRFIVPNKGIVRECFASDWTPLPGIGGEVVEPGHHYEWAFLLDRWASMIGKQRPDEVSELIAFADASGIDPGRGVAVNAIRSDGAFYDAVARLWPQTERLRTYAATSQPACEQRLLDLIGAVKRYLDVPIQGLWHENLAPDGQFTIEAAPASSLYHLVGAISELCSVYGGQRGVR